VSEIRRRRVHLSRLSCEALAKHGEARFTPVGFVTFGILVDPSPFAARRSLENLETTKLKAKTLGRFLS